MNYLGICEHVLRETNSYNTAKEIHTQPEIWNNVVNTFEESKEIITEFLNKVGKDTQVIFTGAGTSEYVGNILAPMLNSMQDGDFVSIATTDIVNNPLHYLKKDKKVLLVSFARSGNSPESVATIKLVNSLVKEVYHLFITCNPKGELALMSVTPEFVNNTLMLLMPEGTNDKGFAMTSSFSSMLMMATLIFYNKTNPENMREAISLVKKEIDLRLESIKALANEEQDRIIILGDGAFKGLAEELTLKVMELTAGKVVAKSDTTLGFRHGPKSVINNNTIVFLLLSNEEYSRKYALDILSEMKSENVANNIVTYSLKDCNDVKEATKVIITPNTTISLEKAIFTYLIYGQMYAFFKSQHFNLTTDNPFPSGEVNRVVKKFQIHEF
ncbi:SIS domain-containing protein [Streptobacillus moniliformis]|uniref:Sugar isomerase (SIS) n=1 Tax=Streptobacillus moniliformis (strain ATCC 14647 / DSM 12112 / NCTC 10651 / 9901) TaxID=519441 RepID=D1AWG1_STRM9|nr:SIS domain-containing protein [Streptobacillus moniliformis]ACZ00637.1 sugar isomerase (SIS) [Streptobacillus moniliformis DSM 12112]AVL42952.1 SIS domain-containing protein [Streptobacillus moniliformis]QXW65404.1 SIS domain-containing protein [Streptobacillus moniliformis]SQA14235.1 Putative tagatose-6-phosphate ketose/aldose isomerase [Streptobacillus moniliformis]